MFWNTSEKKRLAPRAFHLLELSLSVSYDLVISTGRFRNQHDSESGPPGWAGEGKLDPRSFSG